jgi:hypothetical protein
MVISVISGELFFFLDTTMINACFEDLHENIGLIKILILALRPYKNLIIIFKCNHFRSVVIYKLLF